MHISQTQIPKINVMLHLATLLSDTQFLFPLSAMLSVLLNLLLLHCTSIFWDTLWVEAIEKLQQQAV
jgi:hypothetical protein